MSPPGCDICRRRRRAEKANKGRDTRAATGGLAAGPAHEYGSCADAAGCWLCACVCEAHRTSVPCARMTRLPNHCASTSPACVTASSVTASIAPVLRHSCVSYRPPAASHRGKKKVNQPVCQGSRTHTSQGSMPVTPGT